MWRSSGNMDSTETSRSAKVPTPAKCSAQRRQERMGTYMAVTVRSASRASKMKTSAPRTLCDQTSVGWRPRRMGKCQKLTTEREKAYRHAVSVKSSSQSRPRNHPRPSRQAARMAKVLMTRKTHSQHRKVKLRTQRAVISSRQEWRWCPNISSDNILGTIARAIMTAPAMNTSMPKWSTCSSRLSLNLFSFWALANLWSRPTRCRHSRVL
mmetsp:Transcript_9628/g.21212  ORF Transcript_9628/g.21212 Transcript_9628/m.21212 type:complete len:210 (+) Transcript_9628:173-802(+)